MKIFVITSDLFCRLKELNFKTTINNFLIVLSLALLSLGQFQKIAFGIGLSDITLILFLLINTKDLIKSINSSKTNYGWCFIVIAAFSWTINMFGKPPAIVFLAFGYLARWVIYYLVFCLISNLFTDKAKSWLGKVLLYYSVTILVIGFSQIVFYPDMRILSVLGWDDHYFRLIGSWLDPNYTGLLFVLALLKIVSEITKKNISKIVWLATAFLIGILLTYSRSSYLALLVGLLFLYRWKAGLLISLLTGVVIFLYALVIPRPSGEGGNLLRQVSISARLRNYEQGMQIIKANPLFGVGFNYYKITQEKYGFIPSLNKVNINSASGNDNSFIFILATTGLIGFFTFLYLWIIIFISGNKLTRASLATVTIHSLFNNSIFFPAVILWLWLVISINSNHKSQITNNK